MINAKELKLYIEDMPDFKQSLKKDLAAIDNGNSSKLSEDSISFGSLDQLRRFLTPKRLELLRVIRHRKPESIYELAKFVGRSTENVNADIQFLEKLGFVEISRVRGARMRSVPKVSYDKLTLEITV